MSGKITEVTEPKKRKIKRSIFVMIVYLFFIKEINILFEKKLLVKKRGIYFALTLIIISLNTKENYFLATGMAVKLLAAMVVGAVRKKTKG